MAMRKRPREEEERKHIAMLATSAQQQSSIDDGMKRKANDRGTHLSNISNNQSQDNMVSKVSPITKKVTFRIVSPAHSPSILKRTFDSIVKKDPIKTEESSCSNLMKVASTDSSKEASSYNPVKSKDLNENVECSDEVFMMFDDTPLLFDEQQGDEDEVFDLLQCFADQWLKSNPAIKSSNDEVKNVNGELR